MLHKNYTSSRPGPIIEKYGGDSIDDDDGGGDGAILLACIAVKLWLLYVE